jgi:hypothetical protein
MHFSKRKYNRENNFVEINFGWKREGIKYRSNSIFYLRKYFKKVFNKTRSNFIGKIKKR